MVEEFKEHNYWAFILGGSSGLGLASAKKLAKHGMNICIVHRNAKVDMEAINKEFEAIRDTGVKLLSFNMDASNAEKRNTLLQTFKEQAPQGKIRCLLHSIAKGSLKPMTGESPLAKDDFLITMEHMAINIYEWTQELHQEQLFAKDARVLAFTSEGSEKPMKYYAAVSAAKAALEAIIRSIALEFAPFGIRANSVLAGITETKALKIIPGSDELLDYARKRTPLGRLTTADDVANAVYLLCKDESTWINGTVVKVDGGLHLN